MKTTSTECGRGGTLFRMSHRIQDFVENLVVVGTHRVIYGAGSGVVEEGGVGGEGGHGRRFVLDREAAR